MQEYLPKPIRFHGGGDDEEESDPTLVAWTKVGFMVLVIAEALIAGLFPTWSPTCRENPKILGIANSFAGGVFLAIALCHIVPEAIETWNGLSVNTHVEHAGTPDEETVENEKIFPLPELLVFCGYTIILIIDKVLFDTHALFEDDHGHTHDPAAGKME